MFLSRNWINISSQPLTCRYLQANINLTVGKVFIFGKAELAKLNFSFEALKIPLKSKDERIIIKLRGHHVLCFRHSNVSVFLPGGHCFNVERHFLLIFVFLMDKL